MFPTGRSSHIWGDSGGLNEFLQKYKRKTVVDKNKKRTAVSKTVKLNDSVIGLDKNLSRFGIVSIHEFSHRLQNLYPKAQSVFQRFFEHKTKREKEQSLRELTQNKRYKKTEMAKEDSFIDKYMGKITKIMQH